LAVRFCNIDYDREIAIAAFIEENGKTKMIGVGRLIIEPDEESAEFGIAITDLWQRRGVGGKLLDLVIEIAEDFRLRKIWGIILSDNRNMIRLCKSRGFMMETDREPDVVYAILDI